MSISNIKNFWLSTSVIVSLALIVNLFFLKSRLLGTVLILIYVLLLSFRLGRAIYPKSLWENFFGLITLLSIISILGAAFIYLSSFNALSLAVVLLLIPFGTSLLPSAKKTGNWFERFQNYFNRFIDREETKGASFLILSWAALACFIIILIFHGATEASIQSPWQTIHWLFWPAYFFATLCLIFYFLLAKRQRLPLILVFGHFLLSTIVAIIVYQIGYGYDPFIHQAAEKIIASSGTIEPKTPYYLGLYALVIFFSRLTLLDPVWIDRLLMPVLFSSLLPLTIYFAFNRFCHKKYALIASLSVLTLPYGYAIMTAPQNLANLWFLLAIFLTLSVKEKIFPAWFPFLLALSAITIHPLAGLPLFFILCLIYLYSGKLQTKKVALSTVLLACCLILPLIFYFTGGTLSYSGLLKNFSPISFDWINQHDLFLDLGYLYYNNRFWLIVCFIALGWYFGSKIKFPYRPYLLAGLVLIISYLLTNSWLVFPALLANDQSTLIARIVSLALFTLFPLYLLSWTVLAEKVWQQNIAVKLFGGLVLAGTITASLYFSYPTLDKYSPSKFFSLSSSDLKAVLLIEQTAKTEHVVLANQMIGAGAIKELGFKKYYKNQYFYSLPSGSPHTLYDLYLEMIYQDSTRETMEKAMSEAGVNQAYFVLNRYWNNFEKIADQARVSADKVYDIDQGQLLIFEYNR